VPKNNQTNDNDSLNGISKEFEDIKKVVEEYEAENLSLNQ
jgi:hypothetical protein